MAEFYNYRDGAYTVEDAEWARTADLKMSVQDLLEVLLTMPEEARRITMVELPEGGYDSCVGWLTRRGMEFHQHKGKWTLELKGDTNPKDR